MKTEPHSSQDVLRMWSRAPLLVEAPAPDAERRQLLIDHVAATMALGRKARRGRTLRTFGGTLALAAGLAVSWGWHVHQSADRVATVSGATGVAHRLHAGRDVIIARAVHLTEGDELSTEVGAHADLVLPSGADVLVDESSVVQLERSAEVAGVVDEQVFVRSGRVQVRVPKLHTGGSMRVRTGDAQVIVHGTAFTVEVNAPAEPTETRVHVVEGVVSVDGATGHTVLTAGMSWSSRGEVSELSPAPNLGLRRAPSADPAGRASAATEIAAAQPALPAPHHNAFHQSALAARAPDPGTLAEQNRDFAAAMAARREGDSRRSAQLLDAFIGRYPSAPLLQTAYVERFRALAHAGDFVAAAREAHRYLLAFPRGFGREEALATEAAAAPH